MTDKIRVLSCLSNAGLGGPQLMSIGIANQLQNQGFQIEFLLPEGKDNFAKLLRDEDFLVYRLGTQGVRPPSNVIANIKYMLSFPRLIKQITALVRRRNIDVVHANGTMNYHAVISGRLTRCPVLWHFHGYRFPQLIRWFIKKTSPILADQLIYSSYKLKKLMSNENGLEGVVIRPPVDIKKFDPQNIHSNRNLREELGVSDDVPIIGTVGNINPAKGYGHLLYAVKSVINTWGEIVVPIVGGVTEAKQDYAQGIRQLCDELGLNNNVFFLGWESNIKEIMDCFDIFVLSSNMETGPMSLMEAMAMELPTVTTRVGIVEEISEIMDFAWVAPPRNPDSLANAIRDALNNPESWQRRGVAGRQCAIENFSLEKCASDHQVLYRAMVGE